MSRLRCWGCLDGHHCRHTGYLPGGMILAPCHCLDCNPQPSPEAKLKVRARRGFGNAEPLGRP
jgi:hypothetical protein